MRNDSCQIRSPRGADLASLLDCWNAAFPVDGITRDELERKIFLDANYDPEGIQVACIGDMVVGFCLAFVLARPIEKTGLREEDGFISMFGVHPSHRRQGIGTALLDKAERYFLGRNRKRVLIAPYTPNYFIPGVDKDRHGEAIAFLNQRGYLEYTEALAADANLSGFDMPAEALVAEKRLLQEGVVIRPYQRCELPEYLAFLREHMPGPWIEDARRNLLALPGGGFHEDAIWLAWHQSADGENIVGYCQHEHEHFGPFGIAEAWQGRGIGTVLLARTILQMQRRGCHSAWVLWTGQRALDGVYGRLGFTLSRRFAIMKKELTPLN